MKIKKRIFSLALAGTMALGLLSGMSMTALAEIDYNTYTITIPSTLTVTNSGWNDTSGIIVKAENMSSGCLGLTVKASSSNGFALVSGVNEIKYKLVESGDSDTTYGNAVQKKSWLFKKDNGNQIDAKESMGIVVEDYSEKPAGTYSDTVTFKAELDLLPPS